MSPKQARSLLVRVTRINPSRSAFYRLIARGDLHVARLGGRIFIHTDHFLHYLQLINLGLTKLR
jgi:hypothetical protein